MQIKIQHCMKYILIILISLGCARKASPSPVATSATDKQAITFSDVEARLPSFIQQDFIHSITNGIPTAQGDGLFFTGLAAYGADCATGAPLITGLEDMITSMNGAIYRDPTLTNESILDGALAFYRGVTKRVNKCGELSVWAPLIKLHLDYMETHSDVLNVDGSKLSGGFDYIRNLLAYKLGVALEPSYVDQQVLEDLVVTTWTEADIAAKAACYRAHLALISLQTIEELGGTVTATARNSFCSSTNGVGMITADNWCGRGGASDWLNSFQYNVWQYRPQRCTKWETPDAGGSSQPAIDYLVVYEDMTQT